MAYRDTYHMPVSITRCSNNYGPYHFPEKLIPLIINNILEGKPLPVYGEGLNVRDWLYVEDHCKAIDLVVRQGREGEIYNVGGHNEMRNIDIEVSELLVEVAGSEAFASAMQIAADRGDEIIVIEPYYTNYQTFAYLNGINTKVMGTLRK